MKLSNTLLILLLAILNGCTSIKVPTKKYDQFSYDTSHKLKNNKLKIDLKNPLHSPLRVWIQSPKKKLQNKFNRINPVVLQPQSDTLITFQNIKKDKYKISYASRLGDTAKVIQPIKLALPFLSNSEYKITQGNDTDFTHNTDWSRYALDFNLKTNDTICAATDGFVIGVIEKYKHGGIEDQWKPYGNFVTIYNPTSGLFTQYAHLVHKGSLVKVGDTIERGQPIALSGNTGQSTGPHLHFNCLTPNHSEEGLISIPFEFIGGFKSIELKKNDTLKNY